MSAGGFSVAGTAAALVVGLLLGFLAQWLRYRYSRRLETREKLAQPLDLAFAIVTDLHRDISYLKALLSRGAAIGSAPYAAVEEKIRDNFNLFVRWHGDFGKAIELELRYRSPELLAMLGRVLVLSSQANDSGFKIPPHLDMLEADLATCMGRIEKFYRSL